MKFQILFSGKTKTNFVNLSSAELAHPASILYKSTAGRYRPVSYPDGPITARYRFMYSACWAEIRKG